MSSGSLEYFVDAAWAKPMVESAGRERFDDIDTWLYNQGLMCRCQGSELVFIDTSNSWCNLASVEAMSRILTMAKITNISSGQMAGMRQFNNYIVKRCNSRICAPLPTSVCIGTMRFELQPDMSAGTISFPPCRKLLDGVSKSAHPAVSTVCIMPVGIDIMPKLYKFPGLGTIVNYVTSVFSDERDAVAFMWHIGNAVVDPMSRPKSVILAGPGGSGKSGLLEQVSSCLTGCCSTLPDGSLTSKSPGMSSEVAESVVSSRMALCYDVDLAKQDLNMSVFKNISGSDRLRVGYNSVKSNCSLTIATNHLIDVDKNPEYLSDAIMRRVAVLHMNVDAYTIPPAVAPEQNDARLDFLCTCIYTRLVYDSIPLRPMCVMMTLCMSKLDDVLQYIEPTDDDIDVVDGTGVLTVVSTILGLPEESIITKAQFITKYATQTIDGITVLRGFKNIV